MLRYSRIGVNLACIVLMFNLVGCTTFNQFAFGKKIPKATAADPATEILCLWQLSEGRDPDGYPCKGFQGQVLFLSSSNSTPVEIDGEVRIYLFDDQGTAEEQAKPLRQFNFSPGSWAVHLNNSPLGPAYSVFVPYVRRGVTEANCALRVRMKPKEGPVVFSDISNMSLSGNKKRLKGDDAKRITPEEAEEQATNELVSSLNRTTTIAIDSQKKLIDIENGSAVAKKTPKSDKLQLVSHEVAAPAEKEQADAERIRQLEAVVQQLMEQKTNPASAQSPAKPPTTAPAELDEDLRGPDRPSNNSRRMKLRRSDDEEPRRNVSRRHSHPLDDDEPSSGNSSKARRATKDVDPFDLPLEDTSSL